MGRTYKKHGKYHIEYYDANGNRHRIKVGGSKRVAEEMLTDAEDRANRGAMGRFEQSSITFADMAEQFLKTLRPDLAPRTVKKWTGVVVKHLKPAFRGMLRAVDQDAIEAYINTRAAAGAAPATINGELAVLRLIMGKAVEKRLLSRSPFRDEHGESVKSLRPLREPDGRVRYLNADELDRLLTQVDRDLYLRVFTLVDLNTGMRRGEIVGLSRTTVDWENRLVRITNTKTHRSHVVFLNQTAIAALESLPRRLDGKAVPIHAGRRVHAVHTRRSRRRHRRLYPARHAAPFLLDASDGWRNRQTVVRARRTPHRGHDGSLYAFVRRVSARRRGSTADRRGQSVTVQPYECQKRVRTVIRTVERSKKIKTFCYTVQVYS